MKKKSKKFYVGCGGYRRIFMAEDDISALSIFINQMDELYQDLDQDGQINMLLDLFPYIFLSEAGFMHDVIMNGTKKQKEDLLAFETLNVLEDFEYEDLLYDYSYCLSCANEEQKFMTKAIVDKIDKELAKIKRKSTKNTKKVNKRNKIK